MAEGGCISSDTGVGRIPTSVDPRSLECPICLDQLQEPKSLPCLHSFCKECLHTYITKETRYCTSPSGFFCPICRSMTLPVDPTVDVENWVRDFPTNSLILELAGKVQEQNSFRFCNPCKNKEKLDVPAEYWCSRIKSYFCSQCKVGLHDIINPNCDIIPVTELPPDHISVPSYPRCTKHKKKMDLFCEDHNSLACSRCIAICHRKCEQVLTANEYRDKVMDGSQFGDMKNTMKEGIIYLKKWLETINKQTESLIADKNTVFQEISEFRQQLNAQIDKVENDLMKEVTTFYKDEEMHMNQCQRKGEKMFLAMTTTERLCEMPGLSNSAAQFISILQRGTAEAKACESVFEELKKSFRSVRITYDSTGVMDELKQHLTLGKMIVHAKRIPEIVINSKPLAQRDVKEVAKINVKFPSDKSTCDITGLLYTSGGNIVIVDESNMCVKLVTDKGLLLDKLKLFDKPYDVCLVDGTIVAITRPDIKTISLVDTKDKSLKLLTAREMQTGKMCYGITYQEGVFTVTTGDNTPDEVYQVTETGDMTTLYQPDIGPCKILYDQHHDCYIGSLSTSIEGVVAVYKLSRDGVPTDLCVNEIMRGPKGIGLDQEGNLYFCGYWTNNVVQMRNDGSNVREILESSEILRRPYAISMQADKFVLSTEYDNSITIYGLI